MGRVIKVKGRRGWHLDWRDGRGRRHLTRVHGNKEAGEKLLREREEQSKAERERRSLRLQDNTAKPDDESLEGLIRDWRQHLLTMRRRPGTLANYREALADVLGWLERQGQRVDEISDLRLDHLVEFAEEQRRSGVSAGTINRKVSTVVRLCRWALREERILRNPLAKWRAVEGPKVRQRTPLTPIEVAALLDASPPELADIWRFFLGTGLRATELSTLEWDDVDLAGKSLRVRREVAKSHKERIIPLRDDLVEIVRMRQAAAARAKTAAATRLKRREERLQRYQGLPEATASERELKARRLARAEWELRAARATFDASSRLVFTNAAGGPWRLELSRKLKPCLRKAKFPEERIRQIDCHCLRHTFGSQLFAEGFDVKTVQELLGHASALMTLDVYGHAFADRKREAVEALKLGFGKSSAEDATKRHTAGA